MPRIFPVAPDQFPSLSQQWHTADQSIDPIPNMSGTLAYSPAAFTAYLQGHQLAIAVENMLGERLANQFAYTVALTSDCPLCAAYFSKRISLLEEDQLHHLPGIEERPLLDFAGSIARHRGNIADHVFNPVRDQLSNEQLIALVAYAGLIMAASVFNNVLETEMDEQLLPYQPSVYQLR